MKTGNMYGIENEFSNGPHYETRDLFEVYCRENKIPYGNGNGGWDYKPDNSIHTDKIINGRKVMCGGELVSPIIIGEQSLEHMVRVMEFFSAFDLESNEDCAAHLHTGAYVFRNDLTTFKRLILFWMANEREIFYLTHEGVCEVKENMNRFCKPLFPLLQDKIEDIIDFEGTVKELINTFLPEREMCLNLQNAANNPQKNTVEIRLLKPTSDGKTWESYIDLVDHTVEYVISMDDEKTSEEVAKIKRIKNEGIISGEMTQENIRTYFQSVSKYDVKEFVDKIGINCDNFKFLASEQK